VTRPAGDRLAMRAVPVVCVLALLCAAALIASPTLRRQMDLSFTRQPEPYVDLYFADVAAARSCHAVRGTSALRVSVASHLTAPRRLRYLAQVMPAGVGDRSTGVLATTPGQVSTATVRMRVPADAYSVRIRLLGRPGQLLVHCAAAPGGTR
jgi:hypothetical protein